MTAATKEQEIGMLVRVLTTYAAWLAMVFATIPPALSIFIVIAAPVFMGSVIWHLWRTRSLSAVNRAAFCGAVAFFPFLAVQVFAINR